MLVGVMLGCLLLAGCASGPIYRPASTPSDYGYRATALTDTHYQVSFAGDYGVARETVRKLALLRAAQVARAHDATRFLIVSRKTNDVTSRVSPATRFGYGFPFWAASVGVSHSYERVRYETIVEIRIGPDVPKAGADVYDTNQVIQHLQSLAATLQY